MQLKDFIPPILLNAMRRARKRGSKLYPSYREAALACSKYGYEQEALIHVICEKTKRYRDLLKTQQPLEIDAANVRTPLGLSLALKSNELRVIDFGGACGSHYFVAKALLRDQVKLQWYVVETSGMAGKGKELENDELRFFNNLSVARTEIGQVDLVHSSGTLQYVSDPYETLKDLVDCKAQYVFLTRLGLTIGERDLISVQESRFSENGPGVLPDGMIDGIARYPIFVARKSRVEEILAARYEIRIQFHEDQGAYHLKDHSINMYGYFCQARQ
jgi:putative methyltransferase (TIGR04325 family)